MALEKTIFVNLLSVCALFRCYLPLEKHVALHLNKLECPLPKYAVRLKLHGPSGSGEEDFSVLSSIFDNLLSYALGK